MSESSAPPVPSVLPALASRLIEARKKKDDAEHLVSEASKLIEEAEVALAAGMAEAGVDSFRCEHGNVSMSERTFFSVPKENSEAALELLKQHEPEILKLSVHPQTLGAYIRETEKDGAPEWWPTFRPLIAAHTKHVAVIRK
jgi:hypothetical protein